MHVVELLHKLLSKSCTIHKARLSRLLLCSESILYGASLSLTQMGRSIKGDTTEKHKIKAVDRLLRNENLLSDKLMIYKQLAAVFLSSRTTVEIFVDWSTCNDRSNQVIRASALFDGRSITIYEEVHPETEFNKKPIHKSFLSNLHAVVPDKCKVIIVTDAGFRTDWFRMVLNLGWDFIGRIRNNITYKDPKTDKTCPCQKIEIKKQNIPTFIGNVGITQRNPLHVNLFCYKGTPKGRKSKLKGRKRKEKEYRKSYHEPWIIATSLDAQVVNGYNIITIYSKRMQIEQTFKDLKNPATGYGLLLSRSKGVTRITVLLLIAKIADYMLLIIGVAAEQNKLHYAYQANTIKNKRVLSFQFLARRILNTKIKKINNSSLSEAISYLGSFRGPACV